MTEYEIAIATLELREAAIWVAVAQAAIALGVGGAQCVLIWRGLRLMEQDLERRRRWWDEWSREHARRHAETMRELEAKRLRTMAAETATAAGGPKPAIPAPQRHGAGSGQEDESGHRETG